ncbi:hypothetical protein B566_EDAN013851 [Ephemera danica]|nr:hypothetical protein B566_EDAN013851 [Ephemera danica]
MTMLLRGVLVLALLGASCSSSTRCEARDTVLQDPQLWQALARTLDPEVKLPSPSCVLCGQVADQVLDWFAEGLPRDELVNRTTALCAGSGRFPYHICYGVIDSYADMFYWIVEEKNRTGDPVTSNDFCGFALYPDCPLQGPEYNWTLDLDFMGPKPPFQTPLPPPEGSPRLRVVQITDVHLDYRYVEGGNPFCGEPTCCRVDQGAPENASDAAGYWGHYKCDMPVQTYSNLVQQAAVAHPKTYQDIRTFFPDVLVFPIFGNHEPHPLNVYSSGDWTEVPQNVSQQWIYQLAADTWGAWLGPGITSTVMRAGYYSYLLRPDLLVIALNNNVCYNENWWLIYDSVDIGGQLVWLAQTLLQAETAGQKVHLLMHIDSEFGGCFLPWWTEYRRIVDRFENIITGQFFGHTHSDRIKVFYALEDSNRPHLVSFSGGSGQPDDANTNYKVYYVDGDYAGSEYRVLDAESWYFNLTEANLAGSAVPPNWQKLYSFNEAYGTTSMLPDELDALVHRMAANVTIQEQYFQFARRMADLVLVEGYCDEECLHEYVCDIVESTPGKCDELPWATNPAPLVN